MKNLNKLIQNKFAEMCATGKLFRSSIHGDKIWELYLKSFPEKYNNIFRDPNSSENNCNNCKNFIRRYGNVVSIDSDFNIVTMFDVDADEEYNPSMKAISKLLKNSKIENIFFETYDELNKLPYEKNSKTQSKKLFNHFCRSHSNVSNAKFFIKRCR